MLSWTGWLQPTQPTTDANLFSPLFQGTKYMSPLDPAWILDGAWMEPPVHKTLPEEFSIRLFRENSSSRLFWKNSSSRLFRKNSSSRLVDSYGRTQLMFYLKHAVPSHSSSLLTVTVRTLSYIWHSKWDMLHVTCYMQSVMCYMWLVTCYVKALLSMGKQGTKSSAQPYKSWCPPQKE